MKVLGLFEGYGLEIEMMTVDAANLAVRPLAETILTDDAGVIQDSLPLGEVIASNELASHVIELKTNGPAKSFAFLTEQFRQAVNIANQKIAACGARLLGTGMHPFMDPEREAKLWPHGQNEIYEAYNRIFDCRGHGWVNLQSVHINLPFNDAESFARLHAAIRCVLPLIPALCASTPMMDGRASGLADTRLAVYRRNQQRIPEIAGAIIPEPIYTQEDYQRTILHPMYQAIAPFDPEGILQEEWLNSRGAIARFDRNAIEIRLIDTQECVEADIALAALVTAAVRGFVEERLAPFAVQSKIAVTPLANLLERCIYMGEAALVPNGAGEEILTDIYGQGSPDKKNSSQQAGAIWRTWYEQLRPHYPELVPVAPLIERILAAGTLSSRISAALGPNPDKDRIHAVYACLSESAQCGMLFPAS